MYSIDVIYAECQKILLLKKILGVTHLKENCKCKKDENFMRAMLEKILLNAN